jgi:hypothetical protein
LLKFVTRIEAALAEVSMIGINTKKSVVSIMIMKKITEKRPDMMERLLADITTLSDPLLLLDKLRELANHEQVQRLADAINCQSVALSTIAAGTGRSMSSNLQNKRKRRGPDPYPCAPGAHNPEATTHSKRNCWFLNPNYKKGGGKGKEQSKSVTNYNTSAEAPEKRTNDYTYITGLKAHHDAIVLDSGASQHMFNLLAFFILAKPTLVYIVTGSGETSDEMTATHRGTARLQVGKLTITLHNALYVPRLSTSLISLSAMVKELDTLKRNDNLIELTLNNNHQLMVNTKKDIFELQHVHPIQSMVLFTTSVQDFSPLQKWHAHFGNASLAQIKTALNGLKLNGTLTCDVCLKGKMTKLL